MIGAFLLFIFFFIFVLFFVFSLFVLHILSNQNERKFLTCDDALCKEKKEIKKTDLRAFVLCDDEKKIDLVEKIPNTKCSLVAQTFDSNSDCIFSCIGNGDCVFVCPQEAIEIKNKTAVVNDLCVGCGKCVKVCPKNLIVLIGHDEKEHSVCANVSLTKTTCSSCAMQKKVLRSFKKGFSIWKTLYTMAKLGKEF